MSTQTYSAFTFPILAYLILNDILGQTECPNTGSLIHELFGGKVQMDASEMISP